MKKKGYTWLNISVGAFCGLLVGFIFMILWTYLPIFPAMLYMVVLDQTDVFTSVGEAYGVSGKFIVLIFHFATAIVLGIIFSLIFKRLISGVWNGIGLGVVFGVVWWILTPFYLMPFFLVANPSLGWSDFTMVSLLDTLLSHLMFGLFLGLFYAFSKMTIKRVRPNV